MGMTYIQGIGTGYKAWEWDAKDRNDLNIRHQNEFEDM